MMNKKSQSLPDGIIYGAITFFVLGIYSWILLPAIRSYVKPALENYITTQSTIPLATQTIILNNYNFVIFMMVTVPAVLFFVTVIYLFILVFRREREPEYV